MVETHTIDVVAVVLVETVVVNADVVAAVAEVERELWKKKINKTIIIS